MNVQELRDFCPKCKNVYEDPYGRCWCEFHELYIEDVSPDLLFLCSTINSNQNPNNP